MLFADSAFSAMKYLDRRNRWMEVCEKEPWERPRGAVRNILVQRCPPGCWRTGAESGGRDSGGRNPMIRCDPCGLCYENHAHLALHNGRVWVENAVATS